ncbi:class I adenylate-forming enzyme family protein [Hydrogenophaga taeniospiralis]|uniref:class I adenylate-forming enzyme family protein n=1 Tax=Hydrogenophaga taeniospiralis TaxID=65656 RepID=UPI001CF9B81B|nr:AMP-binding protein [Hydrogenophaga taeniospiralis]UCU92350.1 AMP-binding protein [Hydrogenophaga taeniospiralis]
MNELIECPELGAGQVGLPGALEVPHNAYAALHRCASLWPDREGVVFPLINERLSFAQWLSLSNRLATALRGLGVGEGDAVALWAENRAEWAVTMTALAGLGAVLVPINTHLRETDLRYVLKHSQAKAILFSRRFRSSEYLEMIEGQRGDAQALKHLICLDPVDRPDVLRYDQLVASTNDSFTPAQPAPFAMGSVQYTSGTTGQPKGAALSFRAMMLNAAATASRLNITHEDRWTSIIPLFHCAGCIMNLMGCLSRGATYVGVPAFDAEHMFRIIDSERCTLLTGVPTSYLSMLEHPSRPQYDLSSLRAGTCGGADCDPTVLARCAAEFPLPGLVQVYGQTEASTLIALDTPDSPHRWETCGQPLDGMEVRIAHPDTRDGLPSMALGQIEVRGRMVMLEYLNQPEATRKTIDPEGWMQTGDLGYLRPDGRVVVAGGRLRDMIIRGGENIYPVEVENLLREHPAVAEVAVFGLPDTYYGETVAAAVSLRGAASTADFKAFLAGKVAAFKHPVHYFQVREWPMTSSGKIKKRDLQTAALATQLDVLP